MKIFINFDCLFFSLLVYAAQIVLLNAKRMKIVMVSSPILIDIETMKRVENLAAPTIKLPFIYARSVIVENEDSLIAAVGVNDNSCSLIRIEGVSSLLLEAIKRDQEHEQNPSAQSCQEELYSKTREKWLSYVYNQMNQWLYAKNVAELEARFVEGKSQ